MRLNTRMRYGTRALLEMARHGEGRALAIHEIADEQGISAKYLEAIFATLRSAGLVRSTPGPQGGYHLGRPADQITLRDLYECLEGTQGFVPCTADRKACGRSADCVMQEVWADYLHSSLRYLEGITLADLSRRSPEAGSDALSYAI